MASDVEELRPEQSIQFIRFDGESRGKEGNCEMARKLAFDMFVKFDAERGSLEWNGNSQIALKARLCIAMKVH